MCGDYGNNKVSFMHHTLCYVVTVQFKFSIVQCTLYMYETNILLLSKTLWNKGLSIQYNIKLENNTTISKMYNYIIRKMYILLLHFGDRYTKKSFQFSVQNKQIYKRWLVLGSLAEINSSASTMKMISKWLIIVCKCRILKEFLISWFNNW